MFIRIRVLCLAFCVGMKLLNGVVDLFLTLLDSPSPFSVKAGPVHIPTSERRLLSHQHWALLAFSYKPLSQTRGDVSLL